MDRDFTMISGPIPVGSPMVMPIFGRAEWIGGWGDGEIGG